ncbi:MAG: hypothetical protein ACFFDW_04610 [Candidatus Thorarchaeota archaeon]
MDKRKYNKLILATLLIAFIIPTFVFPVNAKNPSFSKTPQLNEEFTTIHKVMLYKTGTLGNIASSDTYHYQLKENVTYYFWVKIKIPEGAFTLTVIGDGGVKIEPKAWAEEDPNSDRIIAFTFTPSDSGDHLVIVTVIAATDPGSYILYANRDGFAGWWWMLAAGIGALVVLIIVISLIAKAFKPKKKKGKRR